MPQHTRRGHRTTYRSWFFFYHVGSRGTVDHVFQLSHLTVPTLLKIAKQQQHQEQFPPLHIAPLFRKVLARCPLLLCAVYHGGLGVRPSRRRDGKGDRREVLKATADSTLVCYLLHTVGWDCRCVLHIWVYMWVDLNDCTCAASAEWAPLASYPASGKHECHPVLSYQN